MLAVVHHVKAETVHKDLESGLVEVRTDRLLLEIYLKQSSEAECHGYKVKITLLLLTVISGAGES